MTIDEIDLTIELRLDLWSNQTSIEKWIVKSTPSRLAYLIFREPLSEMFERCSIVQ